MRPTPFHHHITTLIARRLHLGILAGCFVVTSIAGASPLEPGRNALPLPLDHSIQGFATPREPALYAVEVTTPSFVIVEVHASGSPSVPHRVRFVDRDGQPPATDLPLPAIQGRQVRWIAEPGTYDVEVIANRLGGAGFRLQAWAVARRAAPPSREPMDETDEICTQPPTREPMDETDEICTQPPTREPMDETDEICTQPPTREPMDETDEITGGVSSWREVPGYGLIEGTPFEHQARYHPWCAWTERPELLSTFTCARQLRIDRSRTITIHPIAPNGFEMIELALSTTGRITFEVAGGLEPTLAVFDARGQLLAEPTTGEPVWVEAGRAFFQIETGTDRESVMLDVEVD